ncbi:XPC-binding domain-containing protein [Pyronema omphalodes]|nr:XPC-binding domain-containing protein [Pyronema omphalodes]
MKLTFKDLKQQKFTLDAEPSDTIAQVKEKIFKHKEDSKEWDPSLQKLIYSGKILADDKTVEFYKVEEKGFIVCMLAKPKPAPAAAPAAAAPAAAAPPATPAQTRTVAPPSAPAPAAAAAPARDAAPATPSPAPAVSAAFNDPSALALGPQLNAAINGMMEMGFPRDAITRAMRAAFNNPDRAVEYLMSGIPDHLQEQAPRAAPAAAAPAAPTAPAAAQPAVTSSQPAAEPENINLFEAAAAAAAGRGNAGARASGAAALAAAGVGGSAQGLDFLRNNSQFQQLRRLVQESPQMLEPILQSVGQGNPQLASLISQNPDAFLSLLAEDADDGSNEIMVSEEEHAAIERLCQLGFHRNLVIQAYMACDKDEEVAANYLFDHPEDDDDMEGTGA